MAISCHEALPAKLLTMAAGGFRGLTREAGRSYWCLRLQGRRKFRKNSRWHLKAHLEVGRVIERSVLFEDNRKGSRRRPGVWVPEVGHAESSIQVFAAQPRI